MTTHDPRPSSCRRSQLDPTLWCAFESLCQLDANVEPSQYFGPGIGDAATRPPPGSRGTDGCRYFAT
jgi:hypothetical protein